MIILKLVGLAPLLIVLLQMYNFVVAKKGEERQKGCRRFGIACTTLGIASLMMRSVPWAFAGLFLIMMGLRLIAHGLDRLNKTVFIDRLAEDTVPAAEHPASPAAAVTQQKGAVATGCQESVERSSNDAPGTIAEPSVS